MPAILIAIVIILIGNSFCFAQSSTFKEIDKDTYGKLKNVCDAAHHLQKTIQEIIFEVTRQDYAIASEPNVVGPIVIPAIPPPTGAIPIGIFFPPRKKYMDFYAKQSQDLLSMLTEESAMLPTEAGNDTDLSNNLISIKKHLENLKTENDAMQQLMAGPSYNNLLIGKQAIQMSDEIDQMKQLFKNSEKEIHTNSKHAEKN